MVTDYSELIERLRDPDNCNVLDDVEDAADAIEELQALSLSLVGKLEKWCATYPSADLLPVQAQMPKMEV